VHGVAQFGPFGPYSSFPMKKTLILLSIIVSITHVSSAESTGNPTSPVEVSLVDISATQADPFTGSEVLSVLGIPHWKTRCFLPRSACDVWVRLVELQRSPDGKLQRTVLPGCLLPNHYEHPQSSINVALTLPSSNSKTGYLSLEGISLPLPLPATYSYKYKIQLTDGCPLGDLLILAADLQPETSGVSLGTIKRGLALEILTD